LALAQGDGEIEILTEAILVEELPRPMAGWDISSFGA